MEPMLRFAIVSVPPTVTLPGQGDAVPCHARGAARQGRALSVPSPNVSRLLCPWTSSGQKLSGFMAPSLPCWVLLGKSPASGEAALRTDLGDLIKEAELCLQELQLVFGHDLPDLKSQRVCTAHFDVC